MTKEKPLNAMRFYRREDGGISTRWEGNWAETPVHEILVVIQALMESATHLLNQVTEANPDKLPIPPGVGG